MTSERTCRFAQHASGPTFVRIPAVRTVVGIDYRPALLSRAGIGRAVRELSRALARRDDVELHLFGHSFARARTRCEIPHNVRLHRLPIPGRTLPLLARVGIGADRLCGSPSVMHETDYVPMPLTKAQRVLTVHDLAFFRDPSWHGGDAARLQQRTIASVAQSKRVITPSRATASDLLRFANGSPTPIVIPFGADHVKPRDEQRRDDLIVCIGTIEPRKNHLALIKALRLMPTTRPRVVVIGRRGWECDAIERELLAAQAEGLLRWIEDADDDATFAWMREASVLAYPSAWEGFGFPPLEAMAMGLPVVANDCEPMRELTDGNALLCNAHDATALADALLRALADRELRDRLHRGGLARAAMFRWDDCASAHAAVYREAAQ